MFEKLEELIKEHQDLEKRLADPEVLSNLDLYREINKSYASLSEIVNVYRAYRSLKREANNLRQLREDEDDEIRRMAQEELVRIEENITEQEIRLKRLLLPRDPNDDKNVILEIRAGTGGEEAALFASDLFKMYARYTENQRWKMEILSSNPTGIGGFKEIISLIQGDGVFSHLKFEAGVHRVQRVPQTEASGRIHTSAVTVAVLPEAEDVDIELDPNDLRIDVYRSSGPGGQSVNTTDSAVRITYLPTNLVVSCQDEKSQLKNKNKAMKILRSRLLVQAQEKQMEEIAEERRSMVSTGDRSAKIRTYNFPQGRVTDHRIGYTTHRLEAVLAGEIDGLIERVRAYMEAERLKNNYSSV